MSANESGEITAHSPQFDRELFLRDMGRSANVEANLLFPRQHHPHQGPGLPHEEARQGLSRRDAWRADENDCRKGPRLPEVDPNKITQPQRPGANWRKPIALTRDCLTSIRDSATKSPLELRYIFSAHISSLRRGQVWRLPPRGCANRQRLGLSLPAVLRARHS